MQQNGEQMCCFRWRTESVSFGGAESDQRMCSRAAFLQHQSTDPRVRDRTVRGQCVVH